jgi:antitoxin ParD1/3/4
MLYCVNSMIFDVSSKRAQMGTTRKTITVTDQQDEWIKAQIEAGGFTNDSEYIRDLIRRDQARSAETEAIRAELIRGEQSGEPQPFDAARFKKTMAAKHAQKAR